MLPMLNEQWKRTIIPDNPLMLFLSLAGYALVEDARRSMRAMETVNGDLFNKYLIYKYLSCSQATFRITPSSASNPAEIRHILMRLISSAPSLTKGGRTAAQSSLPCSTSASFIRLCMSVRGSA